MLIVLVPLVGRTIVPKESALDWEIVIGWMMVVVPVVVADAVDCANAGLLINVSTEAAVALKKRFITLFPLKHLDALPNFIGPVPRSVASFLYIRQAPRRCAAS
jgi:hypothetical protein